MASDIHKYIWLEVCQYHGKMELRTTTYPLEITMNYVARVEIVETFGNIRQLVVGVSAGSNTTGGAPTRSNRPVSGCFLMYSVRSLPGIHSEISWRGVWVIPRRGMIF